ncbi:MAG: hypothetical protein ABI026_00870, partial [Gemmatimonadaceae bacterium]
MVFLALRSDSINRPAHHSKVVRRAAYRTRKALVAVFAGVAMLATVACERGDARVPTGGDAASESRSGPLHATSSLSPRPDSTAVRTAIRQAVSDSVPPRGVAAHRWGHVRNLYAESSDAPLWIGTEGPSANAKSLVRVLAKAGDDGLSLSEFP